MTVYSKYWTPERNRQYLKEYSKKWQKKYPERFKANRERWKRENPDRVKALNTMYGHKRSGFVIEISVDDLEQILKQSKCCPQCGEEYLSPGSKTIDRINDAIILKIDTIRVLCRTCNLKNAVTNQSKETRRKISLSLKEYWKRKKKFAEIKEG